jgi:hypothetical protein
MVHVMFQPADIFREFGALFQSAAYLPWGNMGLNIKSPKPAIFPGFQIKKTERRLLRPEDPDSIIAGRDQEVTRGPVDAVDLSRSPFSKAGGNRLIECSTNRLTF